MKVIGLNASPKGKDSNTLRLVKAVLDGQPCAVGFILAGGDRLTGHEQVVQPARA